MRHYAELTSGAFPRPPATTSKPPTPRPLALPLARKLDLSARAVWSQYGFC